MRHEVVDIAPVAECARRLADAIVSNPAVAAHFQRRAHQQLLVDPRNFRPAEEADLTGAPTWVWRKLGKGEQVFAFAPCPASLTRLRRAARQLEATCAEAIFLDSQPRENLSPRALDVLEMALEFIAKIKRPDFAALEEKSRYFSQERKERLAFVRAHEPICREELIYVTSTRAWRRIRSVSEMWDVGAEFHNCMARSSSQAAGFARDLRSGAAHFFVLRNRVERGLLVAVAYPSRGQVDDIRGPHNTHIAPDDPALLMLCAARNWRPPQRLNDEALAARTRLMQRMMRDLFGDRSDVA